MVSDTEKIQKAVRILIDGLSPDSGFFDAIVKDAKKIHDTAEKTLKTDFSGHWRATWNDAKKAG